MQANMVPNDLTNKNGPTCPPLSDSRACPVGLRSSVQDFPPRQVPRLQVIARVVACNPHSLFGAKGDNHRATCNQGVAGRSQ